MDLETLRTAIPLQTTWGIKKNTFWFGSKVHFTVGSKSQHILQSLVSSAISNDENAATPLLKGVQKRLSSLYRLSLKNHNSPLIIYQSISPSLLRNC
ncbi:hypothetical protein [Priestia megaterium]|uniref:hypothetical protein n=1 Tax=Priestia megaterium TaxID=1404 RepID=UPI00355BFD7E